MPVETCTRAGKTGHRFGPKGFCFTGAKSKEKAAAQGRAIKASQSERAKGG